LAEDTLYTIEFQRTLLKLLCTNVKFAFDYISIIKPTYFEKRVHKNIFGLIKTALYRYEKEIDLSSLQTLITDFVDDRGFNEDVEVDYFQEAKLIMRSYIKSEDFISDQFIKFARRQELKQALWESAEIMENDGDYEECLKLVDSAVSVGAGEDNGCSFKDLLDFPIRYRKKYDPDKLVKTGINGFDRALQGGMAAGELHVLQATPKCYRNITKIRLLDGSTPTIEELSRRKDAFWVYSCKPDGTICAGKGHSARITGYATEMVRVTLDNGEVIECTPEHNFMMRDGTFKEIQKVKPNKDSLMPLYETEYSEGSRIFKDYTAIIDNKTRKPKLVHRMVINDVFGGYPKERKHCHHLDFNPTNNCPTNISFKTKEEHDEIHREDRSKRMKSLWTDEFREEHSERITKRNIKNWEDPTYRKKMTTVLKKNAQEREYDSEEMSRIGKKAWEDPEFRERTLKRLGDIARSDEGRKRATEVGSRVMTKLWKDPEFRERRRIVSSATMTETNKKIHTELKDLMRERLYDNAEAKKKMSDKAKERNKNWKYIRSCIVTRGENVLESLRQKGLKRNEKNFDEERLNYKGCPSYRRWKWYRDEYNGSNIFPEDVKKPRALTTDIKGIKRAINHSKRVIDALKEKGLEVNQKNYDKEKLSDKIKYKRSPLWERLKGFKSILEKNNHKVVSIEKITYDKPIPVYCFTVDKYHNFALDAGVFVANSGKSSFASCVGSNMIMNGETVFHVTLEISEMDVMAKYAARLTGRTYDELLSVGIDEYNDKMEKLLTMLDPKLYITHYTAGLVNTLVIRSWMSRIRAKEGVKPTVLICDYDDCLIPVGGGVKGDLYENAGRVYTDLLNLASYFRIPILTFAQPQRQAWGKAEDGEMITAQDLAHSAKKAHMAFSISSLNFKNGNEFGTLNLDMVRRGRPTKVRLYRDLSRSLLQEAEKDD